MQPDQPIIPHQKTGITLPVVLMVWPAATLLLIFVLQLLMIQATPGSLFGDISTAKTLVNVLSFIIAGLAFIIGPVSFIVGLILVIKRKTE